MIINAVKHGTTVNVSINGKLSKKSFPTNEEANDLFQLILKAKDNPSDDIINEIKLIFDERLRISVMFGIEKDPETSEYYLNGFNTPIPDTLFNIMKEYNDNGFPLEPLFNFWKLLMLNPDKRVREDLFKFIITHDFVITDKGYMLVYKAVYDYVLPYSKFVKENYDRVKKVLKQAPSNYIVLQKGKDYIIGNQKTYKLNDDYVLLGNLKELYNELDDSNEKLYTDMHTGKMKIRLGEVVVMDRKECDGDPSVECSYGLHVGSTKYVENFANNNSTILSCLVNPANVVAIPKYDNTKIRVSEYYPLALATYIDNKIIIEDQFYFECDYSDYEEAQLNDLIEKVKLNETPIKNAINSEIETRPMGELIKIIKSRLIEI